MTKLITRLIGIYLNLLAWIAPRSAAERGFLLFCRPFRSPITEKQKEFFNTADKFVMTFEGVNIQCYKWGRGDKKILFLHGWKSHTLYRSVIQR
jgi:hypothetical protein